MAERAPRLGPRLAPAAGPFTRTVSASDIDGIAGTKNCAYYSFGVIDATADGVGVPTLVGLLVAEKGPTEVGTLTLFGLWVV